MIAALVAAVALSQSPATELRVAIDDLRFNVPEQHWTITRYVSFYALRKDEYLDAGRSLAYVLNSTSRSAIIAYPVPVLGTDQRLWRIHLKSYAPRERDLNEWIALWETLISRGEPYWHINARVFAPRGTKIHHRRGFVQPQDWRRCRVSTSAAAKEVFTDGGWVNLRAAAALREMTGSSGALVRGDWLLSRLTVPPFYYAFAGVPDTIRAWYVRLGVDPETIVALLANRGANLVRSGITNKLRRLSRWQGPLGGVWNTYDVANNAADKDFFRNPTFSTNSDAGEHIAARANGLHEFALFDAAGKRQDAVPANIATDDTVHPPVEVVPMISCVRCHNRSAGGVAQSGLRDFTDAQTRLLQGPVRLFAESPAAAEEISAFYGRPDQLKTELQRDRLDYARAIDRATGGWSPGQVAESLGALFRAYVYESVTPEAAKRELGIPPTLPLRAVLGASGDPVILLLCQGVPVQREQWEASYAEAALLSQTHVPRNFASPPFPLAPGFARDKNYIHSK